MSGPASNAVGHLSSRDWEGYEHAVAALLARWPGEVGRSRDRDRYRRLEAIAAAFANESETVVMVPGPVPWRPMSTTEAAAALRVSEVTVRSWCSAGRLRARRLGREWAIDPTSIPSQDVRDIRADGGAAA